MPALPYGQIRAALDAQPLFEAKSWRLAPEAWRLSPDELAQMEAIGAACLEYHRALENLYLRSAAGKNLLRNKPLLAPWAAEYLDRGKPAELIAHARDPRNRGALPTVLRPDLLLTDKGLMMTELDSVPGGIGLTAFLNRLYGPDVVGGDDAMVRNFYATLAALAPARSNPLVALVVSDEAATYRPEMQWLAEQLQSQGHRVFCLKPEDIFPLGGALFFDRGGNPEKIDIIYRFFELFDLGNIKTAKYFLEAWTAGEVAIVPPMRHFQEEKLGFALFHHHLLRDYWAEILDGKTLKVLKGLIPPSWVMDSAPIPPGAILDGPQAGGRPLSDWRDLAHASQKERELIIKISGYHETSWGARSVVLGSDSSREEWQEGVNRAVEMAPRNLHILQTYEKPKRVRHPVYDGEPPEAKDQDGRVRLCPYYFIVEGKARLSGVLATFCPPDKKIIHGMQDAALLPARAVTSAT